MSLTHATVRTRTRSTLRLLAVAALMCSACSTSDSGISLPVGDDDAYDPDGTAESASGASSSAGTGGNHGADGASSGGEPNGGNSAPPDVPTMELGEYAECPTELPPEWIFCEDFEQVELAKRFFNYQSADGAFVLSDSGGASGFGAMQATYREGEEAAGFLSISFGENPIMAEGPQTRPKESFTDVYWRFRIKTEQGWPDIGPHQLTRATAFAKDNWGQAMDASITSNGAEVTLSGQALSCVDADGLVPCQGYADMSGLSTVGDLLGETPLFSSKLSGDWHCVEAHVRLNTPGELDGVFEFWVDGLHEDGLANMDWRGSWASYGLNMISIENFWAGGAPKELSRWIDDIVISTQPVGCEQ